MTFPHKSFWVPIRTESVLQDHPEGDLKPALLTLEDLKSGIYEFVYFTLYRAKCIKERKLHFGHLMALKSFVSRRSGTLAILKNLIVMNLNRYN